jgi:DNA phosphorothioation-associated putative methyltransferase
MIERHKTAIKRYKLSRPVLLLSEHNLLKKETSFFDYGCGHGQDTELLLKNNFENVNYFDPFYCPENPLIESDLVNLGYVINVIENPQERAETLKKAFSLAKVAICVSAMIRSSSNASQLNCFADGELSMRGTFQKYFEQSELKNYLESTLQADAIPLEPGIFIVFKNEIAKLEYLTNRYRRRVFLEVTKLDVPTGQLRKVRILRKKIEELILNSPYFPQVVKAVETLGRIPTKVEYEPYAILIDEFKSKKKVEQTIFSAINYERFEKSRESRINEILVFLAGRRFDRKGFPKKSDLPHELVRDIENFFVNYKDSLAQATDLLFSIGNEITMNKCFKNAPVGKQLPQALYIHDNYIDTLPAPLQVKVGVAKSLLGTIPDCTLLKINKLKDKISFLVYDNFEKIPHPALLYSYSVDLKRNYVEFWDFRNRENPPILHRKETFIAPEHPSYKKFKRLSDKEEQLNLLSSPSIGTKQKWEELLLKNSIFLKGHRLTQTTTQKD